MQNKITDELSISIQVLNFVDFFQDHSLSSESLLIKYSAFSSSINTLLKDLMNIRGIDEEYIKSLYFTMFPSEADLMTIYSALELIQCGIIKNQHPTEDLFYNINTGFIPFAYALKTYFEKELENEQ